MNSIIQGYMLGKRLALQKFAEEHEDSKVTDLTSALDSILDNKAPTTSTDVLDSSERQSSSSWGDKMELETPKNTGINV